MADYGWHRARIRELPGVVITTGQLLLGHWPALLALAFLGVAVRNGSLWAAIKLSNWNGYVAQVLVIVAPLGYLLPVIAMLHLCRGSLTRVLEVGKVAGPEAATERRPRRLIDVSVSVLVPFLAVYASQGLLDADLERFRNEAAADELFNDAFSADPDVDFQNRLGLLGHGDELAIIGIVVVAWVLRWALGRLEGATRFLAFAFAGALIEVYWTGVVARYLPDMEDGARRWVESRRAAHAIVEGYDGAMAALGPFANPIDWLLGLVGAIDAVIVVPMAWLVVAAIVLGHQLMPPPSPRHRWLDKLSVIPGPVRQVAGELTSDLRERWSTFWQGLRLLATAGLYPMLLFALIFLVAIRIPYLFSMLVRQITGPVDTNIWLAFTPMESALGLALAMALTAPLLAAAVEWLVAPAEDNDETEADPATAAPEPRSR